MPESKYYYENQPLSTYCAAHDINVNTIRTRIWKKRNNPKYAHLTDQEIVNQVIAAYGTNIKYMYGTITLRQYCLANDLSFSVIISRIQKLKKENPTISNDELVHLAVDKFENHNFTLFYHGIPLKDYCLQNPELNYNTLRTYIARTKNHYPTLSTDTIIDEYLKKEHFGIYRYYYCGIPLIKYCQEHNLKYTTITARIRTLKNNKPSLTDDELVNIIMDKYEPFTPKYIYNNQTLSSYCLQNNLSYYSVVSFVKRKQAQNPFLPTTSLIDEAIKTIKKQGIIYYYDGIPLRDYCHTHNLNANSIRSAIIKKRATTDLPLQEIVNICVETYTSFQIKYYYQSEPLFQYCKSHNINYNTIISRYLSLNKQQTAAERAETIKQIVDDLIANPRPRTKYFFQEQSLSHYCKKMNYSYNAIYDRIKKYREEFTYALDTELVAEAVLTYEEKNIIKAHYHLFNQLENSNPNTDIENICNTLKIDISSLEDMQQLGFAKTQALELIYFLGTSTPKYLTDENLKSLYFALASYTKQEPLDIYILYVLFKTCIIDTSTSLLSYFNSFIIDIINKYQAYYRPLTPEEQTTLICDVNSYLIMLIDYIYLDSREKLLHHIMYLLSEKVRTFYETISINQSSPSLKKLY